MNILKVLDQSTTEMKLNDLLIFFEVEQIKQPYRDILLGCTDVLELVHQEFLIGDDKWIAVKTPSQEKRDLMLYSERHQVVFANHHLYCGMLLDYVAEQVGAKGFFLFGGLYNNTRKQMLDGLMIKQADDLEDLVYEEVYECVVREYNQTHRQSFLKGVEQSFERLDEAKKSYLLKDAEERARASFIRGVTPQPVKCRLNYEKYIRTKMLYHADIEEALDVLSKKDEYAERLRANPTPNELYNDSYIYAYLHEKAYNENVELWQNDVNLIAAQKISMLQQTGKLIGADKTIIDNFECEVILKGKHRKQLAYISSPRFRTHYFQPSRHAQAGERIDFTEIAKIFLDGREIFCFERLKNTMELKAEYEKTAVSQPVKQVKKVKPTTSTQAKLIVATENISQKSKLVTGQMALDLFSF